MKPWYGEGLRFSCTGCGQCCTGFPGVVWISDDEISALAKHFDESVSVIQERYCRKVNGRWSLKEDPKNFDCVFLKGKKCEIYELRPKQCRTFPWWPGNLASEKEWKEGTRHCEGVNEEAPLVSYDEISEQLHEHYK